MINSFGKSTLLCKKALKFNAFIDIKFNYKESINYQAGSAAIFVSRGISDEKVMEWVVWYFCNLVLESNSILGICL